MYGRKIHDWDQAYITETGEGFGMPSRYYFDNRYHPTNNPDGFLAQPNLGNFSAARRNTRISSVSFFDADYFRLRSAQLAYTFSEKWLSKLKISKLRLYATANNPLFFTKYFNPEATTTDVLTSGLGRGNHPQAKSYIIGLNITF